MLSISPFPMSYAGQRIETYCRRLGERKRFLLWKAKEHWIDLPGERGGEQPCIAEDRGHSLCHRCTCWHQDIFAFFPDKVNFIWLFSANSVLVLVLFQDSNSSKDFDLSESFRGHLCSASASALRSVSFEAGIGQGDGWLAQILWFMAADRWWVPQNALNPTIPAPPPAT